MTTPAYLDTSVLAHVLLGSNPAATHWFESVSQTRPLMSSTLLRLETVRVLRHESLDIGRAEPYLQRVSLVSISDQILLIAGTFTPHIKTLDAIHLATLLFVDPTATLITHDTTMARVAKELGMGVHDPLAQERPPIGVSGK